MPKIEQLRLTPRATPGATPRATPKMMYYDACPTQTAARYFLFFKESEWHLAYDKTIPGKVKQSSVFEKLKFSPEIRRDQDNIMMSCRDSEFWRPQTIWYDSSSTKNRNKKNSASV